MSMKTELLTLLDSLAPGVGKRVLLEQMRNVQFTGEEAIAFNDQVVVISPYQTEFACSVNHEDLHKTLTRMPDGDIKMAMDDTRLVVSSGKFKTGLASIENEDFSVKLDAVLQQIPKEFDPLPTTFVDGIVLCAPTAATESTAGVFACLMIQDNLIFCTDQVRISKFKLDSQLPDFIIRADTATKIQSFHPTHIGLSDAWVYFASSEHDRMMGVRRIQPETTPVEKISALMDAFSPVATITIPENFYGAVENASIMTEGETKYDHKMAITIDKGTLTCKAHKERGWAESTIQIDDKALKIDILVNPVMLLQVLGLVKEMNIGENASVFTAGEFSHLMAHWGEENEKNDTAD